MPLVDRTDSVLCIVDTQPGFFEHGLMSDAERQQASDTVERIAWLAGLAALIAVPTVVVEEGADRNGATDPRVTERLGPGSQVHSKTSFSLSGSDAAMEALRATGRGTAVIVGFETDVCVAQSALDLLDAGYRVVAVEDAAFSTGRQHERGMARMINARIEHNHSKGLILEWLRTIEYARRMWDETVGRYGRFPTDSGAG